MLIEKFHHNDVGIFGFTETKITFDPQAKDIIIEWDGAYFCVVSEKTIYSEDGVLMNRDIQMRQLIGYKPIQTTGESNGRDS